MLSLFGMLLLLWPKLELSTPAEMEAMKQELEAIAAAKRSLRCPRPGLWDEPQLPGEAEVAMHAILEGSGGLQSCLKAAEKIEDQLHEEGGEARALDDPAAQDEEIKALEAACVLLPQALHQAVSHEGGCSPYLTGKRSTPNLRRVIDLSKAVVVLARQRAREGAAPEGLRLLLEATRFNQDLMRGGCSILFPMLAVAADESLLNAAERLLELSPSGPLLTALDRLLAADPHPHEFLKADTAHVAYHDLLSALKSDQGSSLGSGVPDDLTLAWIAMKENTLDWLKACPQESSLKACAQGLEALSQRFRAEAKERSAWKSGLKVALQGLEALGQRFGVEAKERSAWKSGLKVVLGGREAARREAIEILKQAMPSLKHHVRRYAYRRALIITLRYRVAVKAAKGLCQPFPQAEGLRFSQEKGAVLIQNDDFLEREDRVNERVFCTAVP